MKKRKENKQSKKFLFSFYFQYEIENNNILKLINLNQKLFLNFRPSEIDDTKDSTDEQKELLRNDLLKSLNYIVQEETV